VEYVGYLPRAEYESLLAGAAAVLALTEWEATMQRSAYEAVEAGVPVVALDRRVLRETMDGGGAVFAPADPDRIAAAVRYALDRRDELAGQTARSRARFREGSEVVKQVLLG
jgi:glycosyltransferase involved in cell wall biosynthesis